MTNNDELSDLRAKLAAAEAEIATLRAIVGAGDTAISQLEQGIDILTHERDEARAANVAMRTALNESEGDMMSIASGMRGFAIGVPPDPQGIIDWSEWAANRIEQALAPNPGQPLLDELKRLRVEVASKTERIAEMNEIIAADEENFQRADMLISRGLERKQEHRKQLAERDETIRRLRRLVEESFGDYIEIGGGMIWRDSKGWNASLPVEGVTDTVHDSPEAAVQWIEQQTKEAE